MIGKPATADKLALKGVRVLDLTTVWAGPLAASLLADMGAEVIKIESMIRYDLTRGGVAAPAAKTPPYCSPYPDCEPGERPYNRAGYFNKMNRNKLGITLDLTTTGGVAVFKRLVAISDVVVENYSTRVMKQFGLDYEVLREVKSNIIMLSMPGLGMTGPEKDYVAYGTILEPMSGFTDLTGYEDGPPVTASMSYGDPIAAMNGAFAVLAALRYRHATGKGQQIDFSQLEGLMPLLGEAIMDYTLNGRVQQRVGNRHPSMAPHGVYRTKGDDKWIAIAVASDDEWVRFRKAIGDPPWAQETRFDDNLGRYRDQKELDILIGTWTIEHDHHEAMQILQKAGVAAGAVHSIDECFADPHFAARGFLEEVDVPEAGRFRFRGMVAKLSKTPGRIRTAGPLFAEHNDYVFREMLGLADEEVDRLSTDGVIGTVPVLP